MSYFAKKKIKKAFLGGISQQLIKHNRSLSKWMFHSVLISFVCREVPGIVVKLL